MAFPPQSTGPAPDLVARDQVFLHRPPVSVLRHMRWAAIAWAVMWVLMPAMFVAVLVASSPHSWAEQWPWLVSWLRQDPWFWVRVHAVTWATAPALWMVYWAISHSPARLILSANGLRFRSGVPLLGRWVDWCAPVTALRQTPMRWGGHPLLVGSTPEFSRYLEWHPSRWRTRRVRVAYWQPQGPAPADAPTRQPPVRHLGLVRWRTPENLAVLNANLQALPLAQAMLAQGVPLPLVEARAVSSQGILGQDVTQHPRLRWGALGAFVIMFVAAAFVPAQGFQEFVTPPPAWVPALVGLAAAALTWLALWPEPKRGNADSGWSARELRWTKLGMAALIGVVSAFCLPEIALGVVGCTQPAQVHLYRLAHTPDGDQLVAVGRSQIPPIRSATALLAAQTLGSDASLAVPIRRGPAGLWWQYDAREFVDRAQVARGASPLSK